MEKSILIIGKQTAGITTTVKEITSKFKNNEVVFICYRDKKQLESPFLFSQCTEKTKLVVFEGFGYIKKLKSFLNTVSYPIMINKKMKRPFTISPKFIIIWQTGILYNQLVELGAGFNKKIDVIL